jgi:hypothetical protein
MLPASFAKLAGSDKEEEGESERDADDFASGVAVDRTQQFPETSGIGDAREKYNFIDFRSRFNRLRNADCELPPSILEDLGIPYGGHQGCGGEHSDTRHGLQTLDRVVRGRKSSEHCFKAFNSFFQIPKVLIEVGEHLARNRR